MARPLSDEKRSALMRAATRVIVTQGLGAQTAVIAREAGVASGSLFTYFETKKVLFNELYLELKEEMASAALKNLPRSVDEVRPVGHEFTSRNDHGLHAPRSKERAKALSDRFRCLVESLEVV